MASSSPKKTSPAGGEDQAWKQKLNIPAKVKHILFLLVVTIMTCHFHEKFRITELKHPMSLTQKVSASKICV